MKRDLKRLATEHFDILIIGGGIMGTGIARDAALRGLKVALVQKNDFASGTSSRSSKLIHGGLRYLEQGRIRLVRQACHERAILHRIAPYLVKPISILMPIYQDSRVPLWKIRVGLWLYDHLAGDNIEPHRILSRDEVLAEEPELNPTGLVGGALFYDCQEDDARFVVETLMSAADAGACVANYVEITQFRHGDGQLIAAYACDRISGGEFDVTASLFINAAGNLVAAVGGIADVIHPPRIRATKGVHLLLPRLIRRHGTLLAARDGRVFFALPWRENSTLVGTTDTDFAGDPDRIYPDADDAIYLLNSLSRYFPPEKLTPDQIHISFAGLRALAIGNGGSPSSVSREHRIVNHRNGLISIIGGKFTTHRLIAEQTVDTILRTLDRHREDCVTAEQPLPSREISIERAVTDEMALTLTDVMWRRLGLFLTADAGRAQAPLIAAQMQPLLGWSDAEREKQLADYFAEVERNIPK